MFQKKQTVLLFSALLASLPAEPVMADSDTEEPIKIPDLTVTADPLGARSPDELIFPVSVLSDETLDKHRSATLGETLGSLPGVTNADFGPGVGRPVIRGLQGSRVQVLEDGLKTVDISGEGGDHTIAIDLGRAEQIEVFRGPATLLYGSGAAGGVINVTSGRFNPDFSDTPRLHGQLGYGYNGDERQGYLGLELPVTEHFVLRTDYGLRRSHDFDIDGYQQRGQTVGDRDTLQNSDTTNDSFSLTGVFKGEWGHAGLGYSRWRTDYGIPAVFLGEGEEEQERIHADYDRFDFRSEFNNPLPGFTTARLKLSHTEYNQEEIGIHFHDGALEERHVETAFDNNESELRLELVHHPVGLWQGVIGLQLNNREFGAEGEGHGHGHGSDGFYIRDNDTRSMGLFVLEERLTDFGRLEFAARLDHVRSDPASLAEERHINLPGGGQLHQEARLGSRSYTPLSLSAGAIIELDDRHHLRLALTRSERAPSAEQLYAFGAHAASGTVEIGNAGLDMETYTNFEIGLDRHAGPVRFDTTLFYNHVQDFIYLASMDDGSGKPILIDDDVLVFNQQDDARFYGAEFTAAWDVVRQGPLPVTLRLSGDYVRAKLDNGDNLPRISPARLGLGIDTAYQDWSLSVDYRRVFSQNKHAELESSTSGYNLLSLDAGWRPDSLKGAEIFIQGRNLLNEDGRRHQSFFKDKAPIIGRTIMTGIRFDFGG